MWQYDVFLCHASDDKEEIARPLASMLREAHLEVWYDEFSLALGDSLREAIDRGLARSRFAVVILSPAFLKKNWTMRELSGFIAREMQDGKRVVLPIWHDLGRDEIMAFSPPMADVFAIATTNGLPSVVQEILRVIRPRPSPLVVARDELTRKGLPAPSVTDEWWLDVVEASNREPNGGLISQRQAWGRWTFPLQPDSIDQVERGERLAQVALQMLWSEAADAQNISQLAHPTIVLAFIDAHPGLRDACHDFPHYLASYAPQLTIHGFGGDFEVHFDEMYEASLAERTQSGSGLTSTGLPPRCSDIIALRDSAFGDYQPALIACNYIQGDLGGPSTRTYEPIDYAAWLVSVTSDWVPSPIRAYLLRGVAEWAQWTWTAWATENEKAMGMDPYPCRGRLHEWLRDLNDEHAEPPPHALTDLIHRSSESKRLLGLQESAEVLAQRILSAGFISAFVTDPLRRRDRIGKTGTGPPPHTPSKNRGRTERKKR